MNLRNADEELSRLEHPVELLRELYKGKHAPRPGQAFDEETGLGSRRFNKGHDYLVKAAPLIEKVLLCSGREMTR